MEWKKRNKWKVPKKKGMMLTLYSRIRVFEVTCYYLQPYWLCFYPFKIVLKNNLTVIAGTLRNIPFILYLHKEIYQNWLFDRFKESVQIMKKGEKENRKVSNKIMCVYINILVKLLRHVRRICSNTIYFKNNNA